MHFKHPLITITNVVAEDDDVAVVDNKWGTMDVVCLVEDDDVIVVVFGKIFFESFWCLSYLLLCKHFLPVLLLMLQ